MNLIEFKKFKIAIHPLFLMLAVITIALGYIEQFFIIFSIVTIHELAHIAVAKLYGAKLSKIIIYPIGEMAIIENLFLVKPLKRIAIICAGPAINIALGLLFIALGNNDIFKFISMTNFSIAIFNSLPIYPLDGGRLVHLILSTLIGILNSNEVIILISKFFILVITLIGIIQVILYPFNISLICLGMYLKSSIKKEEFNLSLDFFEIIFTKTESIKKHKCIYTNIVTVSEDTCIRDILKYLKVDRLYKIYIVDKDLNSLGVITENQLIKFIIKYGIRSSIKKAIKDFN